MIYSAHGKQVKCGDGHVADCASPALANAIAALLNLPLWLEARADRLRPFSHTGARMLSVVADDIRNRLHEGDD